MDCVGRERRLRLGTAGHGTAPGFVIPMNLLQNPPGGVRARFANQGAYKVTGGRIGATLYLSMDEAFQFVGYRNP